MHPKQYLCEHLSVVATLFGRWIIPHRRQSNDGAPNNGATALASDMMMMQINLEITSSYKGYVESCIISNGGEGPDKRTVVCCGIATATKAMR